MCDGVVMRMVMGVGGVIGWGWGDGDGGDGWGGVVMGADRRGDGGMMGGVMGALSGRAGTHS